LDNLDAALVELKMQPKNINQSIKNAGNLKSQSPLDTSTFREFEAIKKQMSQNRLGRQAFAVKTTSQGDSSISASHIGLPPTKPSSAHPSRRPTQTRIMHNNRTNFARMMSTRDNNKNRQGHMFRNKTTIASIK